VSITAAEAAVTRPAKAKNADEPRTIRRFDMSAPQLFYTLTRIAFPNKALHEKRAFRFGRRYVGNSRDQVQICGARSPERSGLRPDRRGSKPNEVEKLFLHRTLSGVQGWLGKHNRCIVPADLVLRILGYEAAKTPKWFALSQDRPLFAFAGLWTPWRGVRGPKSAPVDGQHEVFGFLTTEPNAVVAPIHPKAMPVTLTTPAEVDLWLLADAPKALELQRPLPDHALRVVASVKRKMARARTPRLAGIKTRCFRFDALPRFQLTQARFAATSNGLLAREAVPRPSA
jgi:putative SOS response-associated peptidase YedK